MCLNSYRSYAYDDELPVTRLQVSSITRIDT